MHPKISSGVVKDYQALGKLLGINYDELKKSGEEPKWRKLEILNELKQLESQVNDFVN
ncbi:hypothetical protein [Pleionea sediminis]|uniref:hypothetical protein n=1 Tax=Pleionea sediminis TaxID=2569479 RepID=UPI0013DE21E8|nr:hypothetical protein [Pleionea sediminis]